VLPDGIFPNQKHQLGFILEGLAIEDVGILMAILSTLGPNCIVHGHLVLFVVILVYFSRFGMLYREKSGNLVRKTTIP
jgi:hypothetical protein